MNSTPDNVLESNRANIAGIVSKPLQFSHKTYGEVFYTFTVGVERKSGYEDEIIIMISDRLINDNSPSIGQYIKVSGQVRTYNENIEGRNKLNIVIFARELEEFTADSIEENEIYLEGFLCKKPLKRTSPLGRKICDIMLAVNRMYNKSDYIPCIAWGRNALYSDTLEVGDRISITGRLQSREYKKKDEDGNLIAKTAYEVSILKLDTDEKE